LLQPWRLARSSAALRRGQTTLPTALTRRTRTDRRHQSKPGGEAHQWVARLRQRLGDGRQQAVLSIAWPAGQETQEPGKGITTVAANGKAKSKQYVKHLPGMQFQPYPFTSALATAATSRIAVVNTSMCSAVQARCVLLACFDNVITGICRIALYRSSLTHNHRVAGRCRAFEEDVPEVVLRTTALPVSSSSSQQR
jgi:hypothetical protein